MATFDIMMDSPCVGMLFVVQLESVRSQLLGCRGTFGFKGHGDEQSSSCFASSGRSADPMGVQVFAKGSSKLHKKRTESVV